MFIIKGLCLQFALLLAVSFLDVYPAKASGLNSAEANTAYQQHQYDKVVELLMPRLSELPRDQIILLGKSQEELKNYTASIKVFSTGVSLDAKDHEMKSLLGSALAKSGKDHDAIQVLKEVQDSFPKEVLSYRYLIEIYTKKANRYELRLLYQDMIEKFGEKPEFIGKLCELTTLDGLYDLSLKYCSQGIRQNAREPSNYIYLGLSYKDTGKPAEAEKYLKRAADSFSKSELGQLSYAQYLEEKKNYLLAFQYYKRSVVANKASLKGLLGTGNTGLEIQRLEDALIAFSEACRLDKSSLPPFRRAANTLRLAKNEAWKKKFEAAIEKCN